MSIEISKIDKKTKEKARMMYLGDYSLEDIAETLTLDMDTLRFYVYGETGSGSNEYCWYQVKKKMNPTAVSIYIKDKISVLDKTAGVALNIINENLKRVQNQMLEDSSFTLSIDDTKKLAGILVDMDKIVRLESGKATDIIEDITHLSVADARRILAEDPFAPVEEVIDAEFLEVDDTIKADVEVSKPWK